MVGISAALVELRIVRTAFVVVFFCQSSAIVTSKSKTTYLGIVHSLAVRAVCQDDIESSGNVSPDDQLPFQDPYTNEKNTPRDQASRLASLLVRVPRDAVWAPRIGVIQVSGEEDVLVVRVNVDFSESVF